MFECLECQCCLGIPDKGKEKATVQNVFINYCNKHIGCEKHVANWRRRRNLPLNVGKKKTPEPQMDHRAEADAACAIVEKVNGEELSQKKPFIIEGDVKHKSCYSWIFKIRCVFCGSKFQLSSIKKEFGAQLARASLFREAPRGCQVPIVLDKPRSSMFQCKRATKEFDPRDLKRQRCIDSFFVGAQSSSNVSNPSSIEDCKKELGEVHSDLLLLC
ncbi:hypothetical protein R1flu_008287 [Riccia fluitans]|uniref:Uncharacterized protein n=1 Tax=Riccia fluitans TaxID=41844 RepID=A0ABD1YBB9_9MARC